VSQKVGTNYETSVGFLQYEKTNKPSEIPGFQALEVAARSPTFPIRIRIVRPGKHGDAREHALYAAIAPVAVTCGSVSSRASDF